MRFWRRRSDSDPNRGADSPTQPNSGAAAAAPASLTPAEERPCPSLGKILERLLRDDNRPAILQLGPFSGRSAVYLAERGARVTVDELDLSTLQPDDDDAQPRLELSQPDNAFDLILLWDSLDFVPKAGLPAVGPELARVLNPGGWVLLLAGGDVGTEKPPPDVPTQFEILQNDRIALRKVATSEPRPRYQHPTRRLENALVPLTVDGVHLQRSQVREFLLKKPAGS